MLNSIDGTIEKWLKERQALLVLYHQLLENPALHSAVPSLDTSILTRFCEALIDYISFGHFRVFEKIAEVETLGQNDIGNYSVSEIIHSHRVPEKQAHNEQENNLIVNILRTTLFALDFNDKYAENAEKNLMDLKANTYSQDLAVRLDWEDELVSNYLRITRNLRTAQPKASA